MAVFESWQALINNLDILVNSAAASLQTPILTAIMLAITNLSSLLGMIILTTVAFFLLAYKKRWQDTTLLLAALLGGLVLELLFKLFIQRPRPENALINGVSYSFPSGHATIAIIYFSLMIYLFKDKLRNKHLKLTFIIINILLILLIGISRVYLNVHWLSDVIAGYALGGLWLSLMIYFFRIKKQNPKLHK